MRRVARSPRGGWGSRWSWANTSTAAARCDRRSGGGDARGHGNDVPVRAVDIEGNVVAVRQPRHGPARLDEIGYGPRDVGRQREPRGGGPRRRRGSTQRWTRATTTGSSQWSTPPPTPPPPWSWSVLPLSHAYPRALLLLAALALVCAAPFAGPVCQCQAGMDGCVVIRDAAILGVLCSLCWFQPTF